MKSKNIVINSTKLLKDLIEEANPDLVFNVLASDDDYRGYQINILRENSDDNSKQVDIFLRGNIVCHSPELKDMTIKEAYKYAKDFVDDRESDDKIDSADKSDESKDGDVEDEEGDKKEKGMTDYVATHVGFRKGQFDDYGGWLAPDGRYIDLHGKSHPDVANMILERDHPFYRGSEFFDEWELNDDALKREYERQYQEGKESGNYIRADDFLFEHGWIRLSWENMMEGSHFQQYGNHVDTEGNIPTQGQMDTIYDWIMDKFGDDVTKKIKFGGRWITVRELFDEFDKSNNIDLYKSWNMNNDSRGWISPDGEFYGMYWGMSEDDKWSRVRTGGRMMYHSEIAQTIMIDLFGMNADEVYDMDSERYLENRGWAKVDYEYVPFVSFDINKFTNDQFDAIYDFFMRHGAEKFEVMTTGHGSAGTTGLDMTLNEFVQEFGKGMNSDFSKGYGNDSRYGTKHGEGFAGWMSPDGETWEVRDHRVDIDGTVHDEYAYDIIEDYYRDDDVRHRVGCAEDYLLERGWVKYFDDGIEGIKKLTHAQVDALYDMWRNYSKEKRFKIYLYDMGTEIECSLGGFIQEFGKSNNIDFRKGDYYGDDWGGWLSPDGTYYNTGETSHGEYAVELVNKLYHNEFVGKYPDETDWRIHAGDFLAKHGWIRLHFGDVHNVCYEDNISTWGNTPTQAQIDIIFDWMEELIDTHGEDEIKIDHQWMTMKDFFDRFGKSNSGDFVKGSMGNEDRGWIDPSGEYFPVSYKMTKRDLEKWDNEHPGKPVYHWRSAEKIFKYELGRTDFNAGVDMLSDKLEMLGWAKVDASLDNYVSFVRDKLSKRTIDGIYDFFVKRGIDRFKVFPMGNGDIGTGKDNTTMKDFIDEFGKLNSSYLHKAFSGLNNDSRGWIDPYGEYYGMYWGMSEDDIASRLRMGGNMMFHNQIAQRIMADVMGPDVYGEDVELLLEDEGWVKVDYGYKPFVSFKEDRITNKQIDTIYDFFVKNGVDKDSKIEVFPFGGGSGGLMGDKMTMMGFMDEFGKSNRSDLYKGYGMNNYSRRAWVGPDGEFYPCEDEEHKWAAYSMVEGNEEFDKFADDIIDEGRNIPEQYKREAKIDLYVFASLAERFLENKGFAKTDTHAGNQYNIEFLGALTNDQFNVLYDWIVESIDRGDMPKRFIVNGKTETITSFVDEFGKSLNNKYNIRKGVSRMRSNKGVSFIRKGVDLYAPYSYEQLMDALDKAIRGMGMEIDYSDKSSGSWIVRPDEWFASAATKEELEELGVEDIDEWTCSGYITIDVEDHGYQLWMKVLGYVNDDDGYMGDYFGSQSKFYVNNEDDFHDTMYDDDIKGVKTLEQMVDEIMSSVESDVNWYKAEWDKLMDYQYKEWAKQTEELSGGDDEEEVDEDINKGWENEPLR